MANSGIKTSAGGLLYTNRDSEIIQSFVRVNHQETDLTEDDNVANKLKLLQKQKVPEEVPKAPEVEHVVKEKKQQAPPEETPLDQKAKLVLKPPLKGKKKGTRRRRKGQEELYTDKDRAAAVNLGSKDIKQSLKLKRREDRSKMMHIPEEAEPGTFLALGNYEMGKGDLQIALNFINKALELNPIDKNSLVARSKCYILLGQPENGLKDAESALAVDKNFLKAIYQKAESLYYLGDFEHSLMFYHRGLRFRPDHEGFKLGAQKAQKAIENAIGVSFVKNLKMSETSNSPKSQTTNASSTTKSTPSSESTKSTSASVSKTCSVKNKTESTTVRAKTAKNSRLLRELGVDKEYLDNLLKNPNLKCKYKEEDNVIVEYIQNALDFLNTRQEFWRQQLPAKLK